MVSVKDFLIMGYCWMCAIVLLSVVGLIVGFLLINGFHTLGLELIFGDADPLKALFFEQHVFEGLFPAIIGTLLLVVISVSIAIPVGILAGIYMAEYSQGKVKRFFDLVFDIQAGIPSILVGLLGFSIAVYLHKRFLGNLYPCLLISALSLAFLVLPYIIRTTQVTMEGLPLQLRLTALAMGATRLQNIVFVLLPRSINGIVSGIILSIGRCAEDTAVIMLTGVVATAGIPQSLMDSYEALPFYIYYISSQYTNQQELQMGYGASLILLAICVILLSVALIIRKNIVLKNVSHI